MGGLEFSIWFNGWFTDQRSCFSLTRSIILPFCSFSPESTFHNIWSPFFSYWIYSSSDLNQSNYQQAAKGASEIPELGAFSYLKGVRKLDSWQICWQVEQGLVFWYLPYTFHLSRWVSSSVYEMQGKTILIIICHASSCCHFSHQPFLCLMESFWSWEITDMPASIKARVMIFGVIWWFNVAIEWIVIKLPYWILTGIRSLLFVPTLTLWLHMHVCQGSIILITYGLIPL